MLKKLKHKYDKLTFMCFFYYLLYSEKVLDKVNQFKDKIKTKLFKVAKF